MPVSFANVWKLQGKVDRQSYLFVGLISVAIKLGLDQLVARLIFQRPWGLLSYWIPLGPSARIRAIAPPDATFTATMLAIALPFIWIGIALTVKRLRDAGQPVWLAFMFFVPVVNLLFFLMLCVMPSREAPSRSTIPEPPEQSPVPQNWLHGELASAVLSIVLTALVGFVLTLFATVGVRAYGWGVFVALPFCMGLFAVMIYAKHELRSFGSCMGVSILPMGVIACLLLIFAAEGLICLLMAAPIELPLAMLGGSLGYTMQAGRSNREGAPAMMSVVLMFTPIFTSVEKMLLPQPDEFVVRSAVAVNAPPEKVWREVISFSEIAPPQELMFSAGVAYPIRAEIAGTGPGAVRRCVFSTGPFIEPIEVWDEPRLLRFGVTENPPPLNELTPYSHIEPPHLHGYFQSHQGQFSLTELPGGGTRLEGTTWYSHTIWPAAYWHIWSDYIIHRIHMRVLEHIKTSVEITAR